jgi:CDGSH-type Zn-finger protein
MRRRTFMAEQTKTTALDNGPYLVTGPVVLLDAEGNEFRTERATVALCRCGGSTNEPFCDGTHKKVGFWTAERAVREVQGVRS